jgi:hypothetical protein
MTYGLPAQSLEDLLQRLNSAFGIELTAHESLYWGVYYSSGPMGEEHFHLQPNYLAHEDEWIEENHREYPVLLYVNETTRPDEIDWLLLREMPFALKLKREDF